MQARKDAHPLGIIGDDRVRREKLVLSEDPRPQGRETVILWLKLQSPSSLFLPFHTVTTRTWKDGRRRL